MGCPKKIGSNQSNYICKYCETINCGKTPCTNEIMGIKEKKKSRIRFTYYT